MNEDEMLSLMSSLDKGTNLFGPLPADIRARLFAVVQEPTDSTWDDAHTIIISSDRFVTLWQACLAYTDYDVDGKQLDGPWPQVPTRDQLLSALTGALA